MRHDADESAIAIARMAGASRREGRRERRGLPKVKRMHVSRSSRLPARAAGRGRL
jgi:hypothetical protein